MLDESADIAVKVCLRDDRAMACRGDQSTFVMSSPRMWWVDKERRKRWKSRDCSTT